MPCEPEVVGHLTRLVAAALGLQSTAARTQASDTSKFVVLLRGASIGTEFVTVSRTASGWIISSSGRQGPPIDLTTNAATPVVLAFTATAAGTEPLSYRWQFNGTNIPTASSSSLFSSAKRK